MQHSVVPSTGQALYVGATTVVGLIVDARRTYGRAKSMTFLSVYKQRMDALVRMDGPAGNCNSNGGLRLHWHCDSPALHFHTRTTVRYNNVNTPYKSETINACSNSYHRPLLHFDPVFLGERPPTREHRKLLRRLLRPANSQSSQSS